MNIALRFARFAFALFAGIATATFPTKLAAQQPGTSDAGSHNHDGQAKMKERGEQGMGFSQVTTTHHFLLKPDGGAIQADVNDPKDTAGRESIRTHLEHIAHAFSNGDFDIPMFVHDTVPPGVPEMKRLREKISYSFEQTPNGGRVVIHTSDSSALAAVHKFLRFQIEEHHTKDPTTVQ